MRFGRWLALLSAAWLLVAANGVALAGQVGSPAQPSAPSPAVPSASISGRIISDTEPPAPMSRARVVLTADALSIPRVAITGADGTFVFDKLPPGGYTVTASATGFVTQAYGQRRIAPPAVVTVAEGQRVTGIEVSLPLAGVIVGQVLDADGRPFAGAEVEALVARTENGQAGLVTMASATTDDRGQFRLTGLPAGEYYVGAFDPAFENVGDHTGALRYSPTYYPGVMMIGEARRVRVTPGVEPETPVVVKLQIVRPATVSGMMSAPDDGELISGFVIMSPVHGEQLASLPSDDVEILPDASFRFNNVPPGLYEIRARGETGTLDVSLFATYRLRVEGHDVANIHMPLRPGASLSGTVQYAARKTPRPGSFTGLRVRAPSWDGSAFGDVLTGQVAPDGSYRIRGVMAGLHYVTIENLDEPWVVANVSWRGKDVTDVPLDVETEQVIDNVRITLTDVASEVAGTVRDRRGRPVPGALVILFPALSQFWTPTSRRFGVERTDAEGRYRVRGLPAGTYRAVAAVDLDESELLRHDIVAPYAAEGLPVSIKAGEAQLLNLGLTVPLYDATR